MGMADLLSDAAGEIRQRLAEVPDHLYREQVFVVLAAMDALRERLDTASYLPPEARVWTAATVADVAKGATAQERLESLVSFFRAEGVPPAEIVAALKAASVEAPLAEQED